MAKIPFGKLNLKSNIKSGIIHKNDVEIEVRCYLPIEEKRKLVEEVVNNVLNNSDNKFINPLAVEFYTALALVDYYTNISFTEKQKEDKEKLYDLFVSNEIIDNLKDMLGTEYMNLNSQIWQVLNAIKAYDNSVYGIMDNLGKDYSNLDLDATAIYDKIADPDNMTLLKDVISKLG